MNSSAGKTTSPSPTSVATVLDDVLGSTDPARRRPGLTYLRRKPGRGLVAVFGAASDRQPVYTVTVDEDAMSAPWTLPTESRPTVPGHGDLDVVRIAALGLTIQQFPHDQNLPELVEVMTPSEESPLWRALELSLRWLPGEDTPEDAVRLRAVDASPVRYKPGDRCVIRYRLQVESSNGAKRAHTVIGKLYRDLGQAREASRLNTRLWELQGREPWAARPLGVADPLPLVLTEDLGSSRSEPQTLPGTDVIHFGAHQPTEALRRSARALADLHTSRAASPGVPTRTGADEAVKARKRAKTVGGYVPELAGTAASVAESLATALEDLPADVLRPAHGSYKPSQLLFRSGSVFLVDFDQFCLADPALDVGYFLAYLRPPGIWYHRAGTRAWFRAAAETFMRSYEASLAERGMDAATRSGVLRRAHVYEAALLLKIAARRPNRLHSARPGEVRALLDEVTDCLDLSRQD